ncbi:hypothetical protein H0H81_009625 [Sphagnurus paluster]|uniref:Uncharacterized protein n=1 Tax=Sphagnurus paluster TaxID=117069 RepID=A0A9P7K4I8_9AGAR|nr:hypothetical protein H0H81_009625 [Sphagnurus paluster]
MAGHKRPGGLILCPGKEEDTKATLQSSLASPPPSTHTPSVATLPSPRATPEHVRVRAPAVEVPAIVPKREPVPSNIPEHGPWHMRNPNWRDPSPVPAPRLPTPAGSLVSTVLVDDDGHTVRGHGDDEQEEEALDDTAPGLMRALATQLADARLVSMFRTNRADVGRTQQLAAREGMHAMLVKLPHADAGARASEVAAEAGEERGRKELARAGSWWMVLGRDLRAVGRIVESSHARGDGVVTAGVAAGGEDTGNLSGGMPGVMGDLVMEGPRLTTFLQLVLAGLLGGIAAVFALSYL